MTEVNVTENTDGRFFELTVDGQPAGALVYELVGDRMILTHTEIKDEFQGQGLGGRLVQGALDLLRFDGRLVTNRCPMVAGFLAKHPHYQDVLDPAHP